MEPATFTLTADDYVAANRVHHRSIWRRHAFVKMGGWLTVLYFALFFFLGEDRSWYGAAFALLGAAAVALVLSAALMLLGSVMLPRRARRIFAQQKSLHDPVGAAWDEVALTLATANARSRHPWADFAKWSEGTEALLLYQSDAVFNMLPKRALSTEQMVEIRALVERAGVRRF